MTKREPFSWRKRRWKVFLKSYRNNKRLRDELQECKETHSHELDYVWEIKQVITKYGISYLCGLAVVKFMGNPNLDENVYLQRIMPPIFINSAVNNNIDIERIIPEEYRDLTVGNYLSAGNTKTLPDDLYFTAEITVLPYVTKQELHNLINEHWPEIKKILSIKTEHSKKVIGDELLGNVRRPKNKEEIGRESLIMKLTNSGEEDLYIQSVLSRDGFGFVTLENIRQIRSRYKLKNKQ